MLIVAQARKVHSCRTIGQWQRYQKKIKAESLHDSACKVCFYFLHVFCPFSLHFDFSHLKFLLFLVLYEGI